MRHRSFAVGPSRVVDAWPRYCREAYSQGIVSINHRSEAFMQLWKRLMAQLRTKLDVPETYTVIGASSATECWEIIAQSFTQQGSFHIYNGHMGEKWRDLAQRLGKKTGEYAFSCQEAPQLQDMQAQSVQADVLCLTHNETSNGTQIPLSFLGELSKAYPSCLLAVDAASSMAGVQLPFAAADLWFASVQKCFGLPAGFALLLASPRAVERAVHIHEEAHYNSFLRVRTHVMKNQAPYTPPVMAVYALTRLLEERPGIRAIAKMTASRAEDWYSFLSHFKRFRPFISSHALRSETVLSLEGSSSDIAKLYSAAQAVHLPLGRGYGAWQETTLRMANFPAILSKEIHELQYFFMKNFV